MEPEQPYGILTLALAKQPKDPRECESEEVFERIAAELGSLPDEYILH